MAQPWLYPNDSYGAFQEAMMMRGGGGHRFDEYYRCYPVAMLPGPERESANHGGKVFLPPSALEKLTRLHITYPMLFELINGAADKQSHAGVLEFIAEEGKIYIPHWLMQTLLLDAGDLVQVKSTDLPPGTFIKLQPQSPTFLDITDPKAVLENAFRSFSCLTVGDIFSFSYNDEVYEIAVLEIKPDSSRKAICTMETDLSVDFAEPVGYIPQKQATATNDRSTKSLPGGMIHAQGTMAQAINYSTISPGSDLQTGNNSQPPSIFEGQGQRLGRRSNKPSGISTPLHDGQPSPALRTAQRRQGPQPLRLPVGKLFFGYQVKPPPKNKAGDNSDGRAPTFRGIGQTLRGKRTNPDV